MSSSLKLLVEKCVGDPSSIILLESVALKDRLTYKENLVEILERHILRFINKKIRFSKGSVEDLVYK